MPRNMTLGTLKAQRIIGPAAAMGLGIGNVYYVMQSTVSYYKQFEADNLFWYSDGSKSVHTSIQAALDETVAERNDYVIVYPDADDYDLTTGLTMTKKGVHLICPAGIIEGSVGATNAARIDAAALTSGVALTISAAACEVAGFYFKGDVDTTVIEMTSVAHTLNCHHNTVGLSVTSGGAGVYGIACPTGETSGVCIHHNFITIMYPNAATQTIGGGIYLANGTRAMIEKNVIAVGGFGDTMSVGISCGSGAVSCVRDNDLIENLSGTGSASTFTVGIQIATGGVAIRNTGCMTTPNNLLAGGTSSKTAVGNWGSASGNTIQDAG